jgi:hypothetical protein
LALLFEPALPLLSEPALVPESELELAPVPELEPAVLTSCVGCAGAVEGCGVSYLTDWAADELRRDTALDTRTFRVAERVE